MKKELAFFFPFFWHCLQRKVLLTGASWLPELTWTGTKCIKALLTGKWFPPVGKWWKRTSSLVVTFHTFWGTFVSQSHLHYSILCADRQVDRDTDRNNLTTSHSLCHHSFFQEGWLHNQMKMFKCPPVSTDVWRRHKWQPRVVTSLERWRSKRL